MCKIDKQQGYTIQHKELQPKTIEAKILSAGVDKMPEADRERALDMMRLMFTEYADYFEKGNDDNES